MVCLTEADMRPLLLILTRKELIFCRYSNELGRYAQKFAHPNVGLFNQLRGISVAYGDLKDLSPKVSDIDLPLRYSRVIHGFVLCSCFVKLEKKKE